MKRLKHQTAFRVNHEGEHPWQHRFYDFNVWSARKRIEKLKYMHRNPVVRGLVSNPEEWRWTLIGFIRWTKKVRFESMRDGRRFDWLSGEDCFPFPHFQKQDVWGTPSAS